MLEHYIQVGIRIIMCKCSILTCFPYFHNTMLIKTSSYMYVNIWILHQIEKKCTCFPHLKLSGSLYIYIKTWCFKKNVYFISSLNKKFCINFTNFFNSYFFICIKSQHLTFLLNLILDWHRYMRYSTSYCYPLLYQVWPISLLLTAFHISHCCIEYIVWGANSSVIALLYHEMIMMYFQWCLDMLNLTVFFEVIDC